MPRPIASPVFVRSGVPGKACVRCLAWKPLPEFTKHPDNESGRNVCRACETAQAADRRARDPQSKLRAVVAQHNVKARRLGQHDGVTLNEYVALREAFGGRCAYCAGAKADTFDHVIPLSRGGAHAVENLVPACMSCNTAKMDRTPDEWRAGVPPHRFSKSKEI